MDADLYGTFAEIGAGQETVRHFFRAGNKVRVAAQSGIGSNLEDGVTVQGSPAFAKGLYDRSYVVYRNLPALQRRIDALEKELAALRKAQDDAMPEP